MLFKMTQLQSNKSHHLLDFYLYIKLALHLGLIMPSGLWILDFG